jgi:DNA-binding transcriptional LysR family regulator
MDSFHLTLRQLQIFCSVAEHGSTTAAATAVALSQSATSAAINELERMLGLELFDRFGKRLLLNDNGRSLLPQARVVLDGASAIQRWAREGESQLGAMRIGASTTIGNYLLPGILAGFERSQTPSAPGMWQVQIEIANVATIVDGVAAFELDFGLIEGPCHHADLDVLPWLEDELMVVAGADDPIIRRRGRVPIQALREATWLLREPGSGTREIVNALLMPHLHHLKSGIEFGNSEAIKRATANRLGITCLSRAVVQDFLRSGALVALRTELPPLTRRLLMVIHRRKLRTHGLAKLLGYLDKCAKADLNLLAIHSGAVDVS